MNEDELLLFGCGWSDYMMGDILDYQVDRLLEEDMMDEYVIGCQVAEGDMEKLLQWGN